MVDLASLRSIDQAFLRFLETYYAVESQSLVWLSALLVSERLTWGWVCVDIAALAGKELEIGNEKELLVFPEYAVWDKALCTSLAVGTAEQKRPMVYRQGRLYLQKYFVYQEKILAMVHQRSCSTYHGHNISTETIILALELFGNTPLAAVKDTGDLSAAAAFLPFFSKLCILSGGPGTGKTTTLTKLLALLLSNDPQSRIVLAAPTGKAAFRMNESLHSARSSLQLSPEIDKTLSALSATTITRLLGYRSLSPHFRHNGQNPLLVDVVVIDEASMVDLPLMAKLCMALSPTAHLILLGDRQQLASVECGSVFADFCAIFPSNRFSVDFAQMVNTALPASSHIADTPEPLSPVIELKYSHRFSAVGGIGLLSGEICRASQTSEVIAEGICQNIYDSVEFYGNTHCTLEVFLAEKLEEFLAPLCRVQTPEKAFEVLKSFQILGGSRKGNWGIERINTLLVEYAKKRGAQFFPLIINENSYTHGLFNGDIGVFSYQQNTAWFLDTEQNLRSYSLLRLPAYSLAYAITIHKSQGSEYGAVAVILPPTEMPLLTRELLYTALTRAKDRVLFFTSQETLAYMLSQSVERHSGIPLEYSVYSS